MEGYECFDVPRPESINGTSRRGHGGVCLFVSNKIVDGIEVLEKHESGFIWVKLCKHFFNLSSDICICFVYIPPSNSVYFNLQEVGYFELLEQHYHKYSQIGNVSIIGDLNSRCLAKNYLICVIVVICVL